MGIKMGNGGGNPLGAWGDDLSKRLSMDRGQLLLVLGSLQTSAGSAAATQSPGEKGGAGQGGGTSFWDDGGARAVPITHQGHLPLVFVDPSSSPSRDQFMARLPLDWDSSSCDHGNHTLGGARAPPHRA